MADRSTAARLVLIEAPESPDVPPALRLSTDPAGTHDPAVAAWVRWVAANEEVVRLADAHGAAGDPAHDCADDPEMVAWAAAEAALLDAPATTIHGLLAKADFALTGQAGDDDFQSPQDRTLLQIAAGLARLGAALPSGPWFVRELADLRSRAGLPVEPVIAGIFPTAAGRF